MPGNGFDDARYRDRGRRLCRDLRPLWIGLGGGALLALAGVILSR